MATLRYDRNWGDPDLGYGGWNCPADNCFRSCMVVSGNNGNAQLCNAKCGQMCLLRKGTSNRPFIPGSMSTMQSFMPQSNTMRVGMGDMGETLTNADACYKNTAEVAACYMCYAAARGLTAKDVNGKGLEIFNHCMSKATIKRGKASSGSLSPAQAAFTPQKMTAVGELDPTTATLAVGALTVAPIAATIAGAIYGYKKADVIGGVAGAVVAGMVTGLASFYVGAKLIGGE